MRMSFQDIKRSVRDRLNDVSTLSYDDATLKRLINHALQDVVNVLRELPKTLSVSATAAPDITTVSTQREYAAPSDCARIVAVKEFADNLELDPDDVVTYAERDHPKSRGVYIYRSDAGVWYVGFVLMPPGIATLRIYYNKTVPRLEVDTDVPDIVPPDHHELIATRAALLAKLDDNRDASNLAALWSEGLRRLVSDMGGPAQHAARSRTWRG